jgi:hypothetical protein
MRLLPIGENLLKGERFYRFRKFDDMFQMLIEANESVHDPPASSDKQAH